MPRSGENATRLGRLPVRVVARKDCAGAGRDSGSPGWSPLIASNISATSSTLRAIGPCIPRLRSILNFGVRATRPKLGRRPTTPQKLAGFRSEPPISEPCASQAIPPASPRIQGGSEKVVHSVCASTYSSAAERAYGLTQNRKREELVEQRIDPANSYTLSQDSAGSSEGDCIAVTIADSTAPRGSPGVRREDSTMKPLRRRVHPEIVVPRKAPP